METQKTLGDYLFREQCAGQRVTGTTVRVKSNQERSSDCWIS